MSNPMSYKTGTAPTIETLEIKLSQGAKCPVRAHATDAGMDFYWPAQAGDICLEPNERTNLIDTGVAVAVPAGWALILAPRSSLGTRGANLANTVGIIDHSYQDTIKATIVNTGTAAIPLIPGNRFLQGMLLPVATPKLMVVTEFTDPADRGGLGSTGA